MSKIFIEGATIAQAIDQYPNSAAFIPVEGGCMCFESEDDYFVWCSQK